MLFSKKARGVMKWIWGVLVFLIIISMVVLFNPILYVVFSGASAPSPHQGQQPF